MKKILIIEDDRRLLNFYEYLREKLKPELKITIANSGQSALKLVDKESYSAIFVDLLMPEIDGFETLRRIRQFSGIPVIMLTAKGDDFDRILGLELGADDYLTKPFNHRELVARIKALTRRWVDKSLVNDSSEASNSSAPLMLNGITLDVTQHSVLVAQQPIELTGTELHLLHQLMLQPGKVVTKEALSQAVLGRRLSAFDRSLDMHVSNIRKKLAQHDINDVIKTMRGTGYMFILKDNVE